MKREKAKRIAKRITAFAAAVAMAATFTFPAEIGDGFFDGFGNAVTASAVTPSSGTFPNGVSWTLDENGKLTVTGTSDIPHHANNAAYYPEDMTQITSIEIKEGITEIGDRAFQGCTNLLSVSFPSTVKIFKECCFAGCSKLNNVVIPNGVTVLGMSAFSGCSSLSSISIPDTVTSIGDTAFKNCSFSSIQLPSGITSIEHDTFNSCKNLTSIVIPEGVVQIRKSAFEGCSNLASVTLPSSLTTICARTFWSCDITSIVVPKDVTIIEGAAFYDCSDLSSIIIPDGASIGDNAIPSTAVQIKYTVDDSNNVTITGTVVPENASLEIPSTIGGNPVTAIANNAFENCENLTKIMIPDGISVGTNAIPTTATQIEYTVDGSGNVTITGAVVPEGTSLDIPSTIDGKTVTAIRNNAFENCGDLTNITIPDGISIGSNAIPTTSSQIKYTVDSSDNVVITGAVLSGNDSLEIPSTINGKSVIKIKMSAFEACSQLTGITIPDSVTEIGSCAFMTCSNLEYVVMSKNVVKIEYAAFCNCPKLASITIPNGISSIERSTFAGCSGLTEAVVPSGVTSIDDYAFDTCTNLKSIYLPKSVSVGTGAIPNTATQIKYTVESEKTVINNVTLGKNQTDCLLPTTLFEKPVYLADASLETYPDITHDHREKTEATCTDKAVCAICLQEYGSTLPHTLSKVEAADPTCTAKGNAEYWTCDNCSKLFSDEDGINETTLDDVTIPALGHSLSKVEAVDPTCTANGNSEYWSCDNCSKMFSDEDGINETTLSAVTIPVDNTAHNWSTTWENDEDYHWHKCLNTGCNEIKDKAEHSSNAAATENSPEVCKDCGYEMSPATGHIHKNHLTFVDRVEPADCTTDGTEAHYECDCGKLFSDDQAATEVTADDLKIAAHHSYGTEWVSDNDDDHYHVCSVCGDKTDITAHSYGTWELIIPPTAEASGKKERVCSVCGYVQEDDVDYWGVETSGDVENATDPDTNACHANLELTDEEIIEKIPLTPEELELIENGADLEVYMVVIDYSGNVPAGDKALAEAVLTGDMQIGMYIDVTLFVKVGDNDPRAVTETNGDLKINFEMPEKLINSDKNVTREYSIVRVHDGNVTVLDCAYDSVTKTGLFSTDRFSTYAIAYRDIEEEEPAPEPAPESEKTVYYPVITSGNVVADRSSAAAGQTVNVKARFGYDIIITAENGQRIAKITEKGSFTMPASKVYVTAVQNETFALMANAWNQSYVYSYDADMNKIKVNSTKKRGVIVIDLGEEYAGRTFTIYSGRKSTKVKVTEGVLDENGKFVFEVPDGKNYTLVVEN